MCSDPFFGPTCVTRRLSIAMHQAVPSLVCGQFDSQQVIFCRPNKPLQPSIAQLNQEDPLVSSSIERENL